MSDEDAKVLVAIQVTLAKIETSVENVLHRVRNMEQANLGFVPRREIEQAHESMTDRLSKLEDRHEWFTRWLIGAWLAGLTAVGTLAKKSGLW